MKDENVMNYQFRTQKTEGKKTCITYFFSVIRYSVAGLSLFSDSEMKHADWLSSILARECDWRPRPFSQWRARATIGSRPFSQWRVRDAVGSRPFSQWRACSAIGSRPFSQWRARSAIGRGDGRGDRRSCAR